MTVKAARRVGYWRPAATLYRTPLADWILRAWRAGLVHVDSPLITVLRSGYLPPSGSSLLYDEEFRKFSEWLNNLQLTNVDALHLKVEQDMVEARERGLGVDFARPSGPGVLSWIMRPLLAPSAAEIFERTGWDAMSLYYRARGRKRGWILNSLLSSRTGETLPDPPDFNFVRHNAQTQLRLPPQEHL